MFAEFSHDTAYQSVKYGIVLNESYVRNDDTGTPVEHSSSVVFMARESDSIVVAIEILIDNFDEANEELPRRPFELLLALSLLAIADYRPPAIAVPSLPPSTVPRSSQAGPSSHARRSQRSTRSNPLEIASLAQEMRRSPRRPYHEPNRTEPHSLSGFPGHQVGRILQSTR